jgi:hypothetical protein
MTRIPRRHRRSTIAALALIGSFAIALVIPIPSLPDVGRAGVRAEVRERMPGWTIHRLAPSWEGGYTVVTSCAGRQVAFQFVPGHGLPADDAWLQPSNGYARERLAHLSDHWRYLVWRANPVKPEALSCNDEVARIDGLMNEERARH